MQKKRKYEKKVKEPGDEKQKKIPEIKKPTSIVKSVSETKEIELNGNLNVNPQALIKIALEKNVAIDVLEKLLSMRERLQAEQAEIEFRESMSGFQSSCPVIVKHKEIMDKNGRVRYRYAPLDDIVKQIKPLFEQYGLSYDIDTQTTSNPPGISVTVKVCHKLGHSKTTSFQVPVDKDSYMSEPQKWASAQTFAKRYAFCNGFGILTGDEDDDTVILVKASEPLKPTPGFQSRQSNIPDSSTEDERKAHAIAKLQALPENIKDGFKILGYTAQAAWMFSEKFAWDNARIIKEINIIVDMKASKNV